MRSMTGYGKGTATDDGRTVTVELKSVNNRYLEINSRLPKSMAAYDDMIRVEITKKINRGSVDVYFNYENKAEEGKVITVDLPLAKEYIAAAKTLRDEFMLDNDFNTTALLRSPDVIKLDMLKDDPQVMQRLIVSATNVAIDELNKMRGIEGEGCKKDLTKLIKNIIDALDNVARRAPKVIEEYRAKISVRVSEILQGVAMDETRLLNEVAFFADKADINEEISRLSSHIKQFLKYLEDLEPQGRKLDFLSQEINREINTIGSKSNDIELTNVVVYMKNELEKIKEQIRNIE